STISSLPTKAAFIGASTSRLSRRPSSRRASISGSLIGAASPLLADAVQIPVVPQQELPVAGGGRGVGAAVVVFENVVGQQLELRLGGHHVRAVVLRDVVDLAV